MGLHLFSQKEKVQNSRRNQRTLFCHPAETSEKRRQERRRPCRNPFGKQFTKQRGSIEHPHRSAGRDRRDIEKWRIRIHQRVGIVSCLHYKQWLRASGRCIASRGTGIQSIFHCRPQVYPTCQPDEILSLPTIQIFPKELVTTRNNQGRRDSGRGTGVHS